MNYKTIAIIAITLLIISNGIGLGILMKGNQILEKEEMCFNLCTEKDALMYDFDWEHERCYCYGEEAEQIYTEKID